MIPAAGALVLVGLALFVAGLLTGGNAFFWACVAACVAAAALLVAARRQISAHPAAAAAADEPAQAPVAAGSAPVPAEPEPALGTEDPPVEEVEVTDLLLIVDLKDEVLVVDERPRYHVAGCSWVGSRTTIPLPLDEARTDGFTPCGTCRPDRTIAGRARASRKAT
ncbi:hypothetical protein [Blastococcus atacamensis]|uniref:hypothetical protein n=1 Tax=Blastococcus atacamensis TaxID=2070508 RepID=UPI0018E46248|nr:hypothetical protein [Blastococcus atacamensis]